MNPANDNNNQVPSTGSFPPPQDDSQTSSFSIPPFQNDTSPASPSLPQEGGFPDAAPVTPASPQADAPVQPEPQSEVVTISAADSGGQGKGKKVLAALVVVVMLFGIGAGIYAFRNYQAGSASAWDCGKYNFNVDKNGTVTVQNGSSRNEPGQQARVFVNGTQVETFNVPALAPGQGATLGNVSVPSNQSYTWRVDGTVDCEDSGGHEVQTPTAECSAVIAYDENWQTLSQTALSQLQEGDVVRFAVSGTASSGSFTMARFSVNGAAAVETSTLRPGSQEFYYEYTIPAGVNSFNVTAEINHSELGWF